MSLYWQFLQQSISNTTFMTLEDGRGKVEPNQAPPHLGSTHILLSAPRAGICPPEQYPFLLE